jgi:hypothetical protein
MKNPTELTNPPQLNYARGIVRGTFCFIRGNFREIVRFPAAQKYLSHASFDLEVLWHREEKFFCFSDSLMLVSDESRYRMIRDIRRFEISEDSRYPMMMIREQFDLQSAPDAFMNFMEKKTRRLHRNSNFPSTKLDFRTVEPRSSP